MELIKMKQPNPYQSLLKNDEDLKSRVREMEQIAHHWDREIRGALSRLAESKWQGPRFLRLLSARAYRIRSRAEAKAHVWWVEHDIPPYDIYRCAAYQVKLTLNDSQEPVLTVKSRKREYRVPGDMIASLDRVLAQAGQDPPLLIPRRMGRVLD
jgi:hypothetical protein